MKNISEILIMARVNLNLTQKQFADLIGFTEATVNRWENGKCKPTRKNRILIDFKIAEYMNKK